MTTSKLIDEYYLESLVSGMPIITDKIIQEMATELLSLRQQVKDWRECANEFNEHALIDVGYGHAVAMKPLIIYRDLLNKYPKEI
jgi:ribosomal protein RSM22 (predicted rRNA methylase)